MQIALVGWWVFWRCLKHECGALRNGIKKPYKRGSEELSSPSQHVKASAVSKEEGPHRT